MSERVLVVAAHPDDEVLGMGGTLARYVHRGDSVGVLFLGDGVSSRGQVDSRAARDRKRAAEAACKVLGADILGFETLPDNAFDTVPLLQIAKLVERAKQTFKPSLVYTHHAGDLNIDHILTCRATLTAFRPQPHETYKAIYAFEVNSSTEWSPPSLGATFIPDTYVDMTAQLETLLKAYAHYSEEVRDDPHSRSVTALKLAAQHRGRQVGFGAAEAFVTLRRLIR